MGQMEMKFYVGQGYSGERCGPWASCLTFKNCFAHARVFCFNKETSPVQNRFVYELMKKKMSHSMGMF
jgi:hypothetical protein